VRNRKAEVGSEKSKGAGKRSLAVVFDFWREHKLWAVLLALGTVATTGISLAFPYILRFIVDGIKRGVAERELLRYVLLLVGFGMVRTIAEVVLPWNRGRINEKYQWLTRSRVFRKALDMGHSFTNRFPTGDVMERLDHDLEELSWFACSGIFRTLAAVFTVLFALGFMLSMNPLLTAITAVPVAAGVFIWLRLGPLVYTRYMKWRKLISEVNNQLEAGFTGIRLVKSYNMEARLARRLRRTLDERIDLSVDTARIQARIEVFYMAVAEVGLLLVLWVGGAFVVTGGLTLGQFVAFNAYVLMLVGPMFDIGNLFVSGRKAQGGSERVGEVERHRPEVTGPGSGRAPAPGVLRLEKVTFAYDKEPVLRDVTMEFPAGARVGVAGTVGSGKSTVFRLLFRLADPQQGRVLLDGTDIRQFDLDAYRALFGYAPQEATLFSDTLKNNVTFGRDVADAEVDHVVAMSQLERDLAGFPKGLEEVLGERGTRLSGGQQGRVAIARALAGGPKLLVFDDATSALDAETEKELVLRLNAELAGTTVIIVSHRLSILSACDFIYVLDRGEVKEQGTHAELLARRGLYWDLYERQLIKEELEAV
jgi:ATP-binding cassette subfamily B multidrug efflux pump